MTIPPPGKSKRSAFHFSFLLISNIINLLNFQNLQNFRNSQLFSKSTSNGTAAHRDRSLRSARIPSLISKTGMIDMMHIGIGPALKKALSKAVARGDRETE